MNLSFGDSLEELLIHVPLDLEVRHFAMRPCNISVEIVRNIIALNSHPIVGSEFLFGVYYRDHLRQTAVALPCALIFDPAMDSNITFIRPMIIIYDGLQIIFLNGQWTIKAYRLNSLL